MNIKVEDSLSHADDDSLDADSFVAPSLRGPRRTESQRREFLEEDPLVEQLEVDRALCKNCKKWIKLSNVQTYSTSNWTKHRPRCAVAVSVRFDSLPHLVLKHVRLDRATALPQLKGSCSL